MSKNSIQVFLKVFFLCLSCGNLLLAQSGSLSLSSGSVTTGGVASLGLALSGGSSAAGLQWTLTYPSSAFTAVNVTAGPVLSAAGKSLSCAAAPGTYTCVATGLNATEIADGIVATASLTLDPSAGSTNVGVTNTMGASPTGATTPISGTGGSIVVTQPVSLSSAACSPSSLVTPGTSLCTVTLNAPAPAGGAMVALSSNQTSLTVPASVSVPAGSTSGTFTASAATVGTNQTATITATLSGNSVTAILTLEPPAAPPVTAASLACSPSSLVTPGTSLCTATLSAPAPAGGAAVALSSNQTSLTVPASVSVPAGSTSGTFTASAATVGTNQTATITATLSGNSVTAILTLEPPAAPPVTTASLACSPSIVFPGASITCTVILSGLAPAGGAVVLLTSNNSALTAPTSVTVPAGSTSATFTPGAGAVAAAQTATLTASLGGSALTNSLVMNPPGGPPILQVGPGQTYSAPCQALAAAPAGAVIQIDAGGTYSGDVCTINASDITLKGVHGRPKIDAAGQNAGSKGTWVFEGDNVTIDTIELTGAAAPGNNGAAIRMEGQNLTVLNSYIHDNQEGIFVNPQPSAQILAQSTEFYHNGFGDGLTHNLHVNAAARLTLQYCYSHNGNAGNLVETGASENYILYNRLTSETGATNAEIDIPNGGRSFVIGNLIEKGASDVSGTVLGYLSSGSSGSNSSAELYVFNNTFVNDRSSGATFLNINPADPTPAAATNNIFYGAGTIASQSNAVLNANLTSNPQFVNQAGYDYHLTSGSPAINAGANPGVADGVSLTPLYEYVSPACAEARNTVGAIDIGGYEFGGAGASLPCIIGVSALSLAPSTVIGGSAASATVTLSNPAPPGGALMVLSSSNSNVGGGARQRHDTGWSDVRGLQCHYGVCCERDRSDCFGLLRRRNRERHPDRCQPGAIAAMQPYQSAIRRRQLLHRRVGSCGSDGRNHGDAVEQRGGVDRAGLGNGRVGEHDGDLHGHGWDDRERPDGDHHGHAEREHADGHDHAGGAGVVERVDVQPDEPGVGRQFDVHGDGVEDGRGDGGAVEQRSGVDRAGLGDGGVGEHDGDLHGHGWDDLDQPDGDHHGHAEREHADGHHLAGGAGVAERVDVQPDEPGVGRRVRRAR